MARGEGPYAPGSSAEDDGQAISAVAADCQRRQISAEPLWFALMSRELWGPNAPKDLEYWLRKAELDPSDRTCRAWASGDSIPVSTIMAILLHTPHGYRVLNWIMRDSTEPWWLELQRAIRRSAAIDQADGPV